MTQTHSKAGPPHRARSHFTMVPDLIGDLDLDPYAFRLYCHLRRVTGEPEPQTAKPEPQTAKACWQSTATLAARCHMSTGRISQAKRELVAQGLIRIEKRPGPGGRHDHITLVDIWEANRQHFNAAPDRARVQPSAPRVHVGAEGVPLVNAAPSPGETNHIPPNQNSSSRERRDNDEEREREATIAEPVGVKLGGISPATPSPDGVNPDEVSRLFLQELGRAPTPLQRRQIADLVALCDDPAVWQRAFLRAADARHPWAYIAQCIRNAARDGGRDGARAPTAAPPSGSPPPGDSPPPQPPPLPEPAPDYVTRWEKVLEVVRWKMTPMAYQQGFGRTVCIGERDDGKTWEVAVQRAAFLGWIQHPAHRPLVDRLLRQCGYGDVTVEFVPFPGPEG